MGAELERVPMSHMQQQAQDMKATAATFVRDGDGVRMPDTAESRGAMAKCRVDVKDMRELVDSALREYVQNRLDELHADAVVTRELGRRVEVAIKTAMPRIEREVEAAAKVAVVDRVKAIVASLDINLTVTIKERE